LLTFDGEVVNPALVSSAAAAEVAVPGS
jgi:hypothetical protein